MEDHWLVESASIPYTPNTGSALLHELSIEYCQAQVQCALNCNELAQNAGLPSTFLSTASPYHVGAVPFHTGTAINPATGTPAAAAVLALTYTEALLPFLQQPSSTRAPCSVQHCGE